MLRKETKVTVNQIVLKNSGFIAEGGDQGRVTIPSAEGRKQDIEKGIP